MIHDQIRQYVKDNFLFGNSNADITNDQSFLDTGIIDSTGVLELVTFIEESFDIHFEDDELIPENLDSVNNITQFINTKMKAAEAA